MFLKMRAERDDATAKLDDVLAMRDRRKQS